MRLSVRSVAALAASVTAVASISIGTASSTSVPGLSATQVNLGAIVTQSGIAAADFGSYLYGVKAYLAYVNSLGGVNHRKLVLTKTYDDQSNGTTDITDARQLVLTDKVFGIVGVSTAFFDGHTFLSTSGVPTFGYATQDVWGGAKNMFADYGSRLDYPSTVPDFAYVAKKTGSTKVALISLSLPQSTAICQPAYNTLKSKFGVNVVYSNLSENIFAPNFATDVVKMKNLGVNMVIACMDNSSNLSLNQQMKTYGFNPVQVWLDGYDRHTLTNQYLQSKTYFILQHVPFEMAKTYPTAYPGLNLYLKWMVKAGFTAHEFDDVALMGWASANLFATGLRAAGASPTQASVITALNKITKDTSGGVATPTNWTIAHTQSTPPSCVSYVTIKNPGTSSAAFSAVYNRGTNPWICYPLSGTINILSPIAAPAGSPGT